MTQITFCKSLKPASAMLHNSPWQIAGEPPHTALGYVRDEIDIEHLLCKISTHPPISLPVPLPLFPCCSYPRTRTPSFRPKAAHLPPQRRNACFCSCLFSFSHTQTPSFRPKAAHLPPQWRNLLLLLQLLVFLPTHSNSVNSTEGGALAAAVEKSACCSCLFSFPHTPNSVISTEGGALAAAAEKSAFVCFPPTTQIHFGSGSGSTVLIPGKIVEVALNFR